MEIKTQFNLDWSLPYKVCKEQVLAYLTEQFALVFSMPPHDINIHHSLHSLGMDSLMALAVIRIIEANLGVTYELPLMMQGPSIHEIAEYVLTNHPQNQQAKQAPTPIISNKAVWIANRTLQEQAQIRLFCFPYGGGGASIYREWQEEFPGFIEVCPIQLPGRENRMGEQPLHHLDTLVTLLAKNLQPQFDLPFAFFGHSFGALIGFELARYLRQHGLPQPEHLFASAYPDPRHPSRSLDNLLITMEQSGIHLFDLDETRISQLDEKQLTALSLIFKENGIVDYSDERMSQSIIKVLLPIFIADMNLVKNYIYQSKVPLESAITVFLGTQDTWVAPEDHQGWSEHSIQGCKFHQFDSGHLFIREKKIRSQVIQKITEELLRFSEALVV